MLDSFEKESRLHERRLARQRQMRLMEEAASGLPLRDDDDDDDDNEADEMEYEMPPPTYVEDVDSEDDVPSMYSGTNNNTNNNDNGNNSNNLWSSSNSKNLDDSKLKFVMGDTANNNDNYDEAASYSSWTERQRKDHDESRHLIMLASRRVSSSSGRGTLEMEFRDDEKRRRYNHCPVWIMLHRKLLCSFCLVMALMVMGVLIALTKKSSYYEGAEWPVNPAAQGGSSGHSITGGSSAIDESVDHSQSESTNSPQDNINSENNSNNDNSNSINNSNNGNNNINTNNNNDSKNELDTIKFERIKDRLLEHQISHASTLEDPTTPQYKALQWLVRDDPRQLDVPSTDDTPNNRTNNETSDSLNFEPYSTAEVTHNQQDDISLDSGNHESMPAQRIDIRLPTQPVYREADIIIPEAFLVTNDAFELEVQSDELTGSQIPSAQVLLSARYSLVIAGTNVHFGAVAAMFVLIALVIGLPLGVTLSNKGSIPLRIQTTSNGSAAISIKYDIERNVLRRNTTFSELDKYDSRNKALNWILLEDPMQVNASFSNLHQRYIMAMLRYEFDPISELDLPDWLSEKHECEWYGVSCLDGKVTEVELGEFLPRY